MEIGQTQSAPHRYQQALDFLFQRINYERTSDIPYRSRGFKLDRMKALMAALGNPERRLKIIHIAGTKGKGSTAAFLANILWKAGWKVGKFTSPHLERLEERFWLSGANCTEEDIIELVERLAPLIGKLDLVAGEEDRLTFFEITTAMAFLLFAQREVDFAVVEVGLGGRLDSTNVCLPQLCLITSISRDHTALLGETLAEIAGEKAGIIKPHVPVIVGEMDAQALTVIAQVAAASEAPLLQAGRDFTATAVSSPAADVTAELFQQAFVYRGQEAQDEGTYVVRAKGRHQVANAALATAAALQLRRQGHGISAEAIAEGLAVTWLPARIECLGQQPTVIVDAAHNDASADALVRVLEEHFPDRRRNLVFASSGDKDHAAVLQRLLPAFDQVWLTQYGLSIRATAPAYLEQIARQLLSQRTPPRETEIATCDTAKTAFEDALAATTPDDVLVVTGSFFIAAEFKRFWADQGADAPPATSSAAG